MGIIRGPIHSSFSQMQDSIRTKVGWIILLGKLLLLSVIGASQMGSYFSSGAVRAEWEIDLQDNPLDMKNKKPTDYMYFSWMESVYKKDLAELSQKLFDAASDRSDLWNQVGVLVIAVLGMVCVPALVFLVKAYLKNRVKKAEKNRKDLESGNNGNVMAMQPSVWPVPRDHMMTVRHQMDGHRAIAQERPQGQVQVANNDNNEIV